MFFNAKSKERHFFRCSMEKIAIHTHWLTDDDKRSELYVGLKSNRNKNRSRLRCADQINLISKFDYLIRTRKTSSNRLLERTRKTVCQFLFGIVRTQHSTKWCTLTVIKCKFEGISGRVNTLVAVHFFFANSYFALLSPHSGNSSFFYVHLIGCIHDDDCLGSQHVFNRMSLIFNSQSHQRDSIEWQSFFFK